MVERVELADSQRDCGYRKVNGQQCSIQIHLEFEADGVLIEAAIHSFVSTRRYSSCSLFPELEKSLIVARD